MPGFSPSDFNATPEDITLSYCDEFSGNSCCTLEYSEQIGNFVDPFSSSFLHVLNNPVSECRTKLEDISCIMCSTSQTDWMYITPSFSSLVMCQSYCDDLFQTCRNDLTIDHLSVSEAYDTSNEFCIALFDDISHSNSSVKLLIDTHNRECWNNLPECTEDSFYPIYTECVNGRRNLIWVKKPEAECSGGYEIPPNENGLPCALACEAGQRTGNDECVDCEPGTFSRGSDIVENSWSTQDDLVLQFNSYCTWRDNYGVERVWTNENCEGWSLNFGAISSPVSLNDSMSAYLETSITLIADGVLTFSAKVDSELNYDGLKVFVDRLQSEEVGFISHTSEFETYTVSLSAGYHFIQFEYYKDISVSVGLDQATINMIGVTNVRYASDYCTPCPPGSYSDTTRSKECALCPLNTYNAEEGATACADCPEGTYAYEGSTECTPKPECTEDDYYYRYGDCYFDEEEDAPRRTKYAQWVEPHICSSDSLPEIQIVPCSPCEPGMYRDEDGIDCYFCEPGYFSVGDDNPCVSCSPGNEAVKHLVFDEFNAFVYGLSTSCEYDCNTDGWVMREDMIDSGTGHGAYVLSRLSFTQNFPENGRITFQFSLECVSACLLTFQSDETAYRAYGGGSVFWNPTDVRMSFEVSPGEHTFEWIFTRDDRGTGEGRNDRAIITKIDAENTAEGGAISCTPCEPGYYNPNRNAADCIPASPGYFSEGGALQQAMCEGNTFTDSEASSECLPCGENISALDDHTGCDVTCQLSTSDYFYDLSPIARVDGDMYGPVWETISNHTYYLNLCEKEHNNHTCFTAEGIPIETYACQVTNAGIGEDLGSTFGILPLRAIHPENTLGVTVHLDYGTECHNGSHYFPRQTYVDVVCEPTAGIGFPAPLYQDIETEKCVYQFQWASLYGCPLCQESDYHYISSECIDGMETLTYEWNSNPRACHGGVTLPDPISVPCSSSLYCGPGQFYNADTNDCEDALIGFYSVGNGFKVSSWMELETGFTSNGWIQSENYIASGEGDTTLVYVANFVLEGSVEMTYAVNNYGDSTAGFMVFIDDVLQGVEISTTNNDYVTSSIVVPAGYHYVKFAFEGGTVTTTNTRARGVKIKEMTILGTSWHADYPIPCPAGTYSNQRGSVSCSNCDWNTYSFEGSHRCIGCNSMTYAFPGSASCIDKEQCTVSDYTLTYTPCTDGEQQASYVLLDPVICLEDVPPTPENPTVPCFPCELGSYRTEDSDNCKTCIEGKYYDEEQGKCKTSRPGNAAILYKSYFTSPLPGESFPSEFTTGCNGDCICDNSGCETDGWRFRGSYADSGLNDNREVDTYLELSLELSNPGSISFEYEVFGQSSNGLEFFVNGRQHDVVYHPSGSQTTSKSLSSTEIELSAGANVFRWNYHQEPNSNGSVQLHSIIIEGIGGATEDVVCPPGYFSENGASSTCDPCPPGTASNTEGATGCNVCDSNSYTADEGSTECIECGASTHANDDRTDCTTNCHFVFDEDLYDLSSLQLTHGPFPIDEDATHGIWMNVCEKRSSPTFCLDPYGESISTYMCQVDTRGNGIDYGNHLSVDLVEVEGSPDKAVRLLYTVEGADDDSECQTTLTVVCDPDSSTQVPFVIGSATDCDLHMRWNSAHGCRICDDEEDYETQESECESGEKTITRVRTTNCYGPVILSSEVETCPTRYSFSLAVIIVVVVLLVALFLIILGVVLYNRRLHSQYTALVKDSEGQYEMDNMEDNAVSDDTETKKEDAEEV